MNDNCIFCKIIKGEIPCHKIYEDDQTLAFLDISNDSLGHTLVIPKTHAENIFDCPEKLLNHVIHTTKLLSLHYKELGFEGINIQNNNGECAGQSVFHLHFHILPRSLSKNIKEKIFSNRRTLELSAVKAFLEKKDFDL